MWQRLLGLLGRPVSDNGRLCHGEGGVSDANLRFDATLGHGGGHIYHVSTRNLDPGAYNVTFQMAGDQTVYKLQFRIR